MNIRLPKTNVEWEITADPMRRQTALRASFRLPNGEVLHTENRINDEQLARGYEPFADHIVEHTLREIEREVGRRMVRGK